MRSIRATKETPDEDSPRGRRARGRADFIWFCRYYLGHYFVLPPSRMHLELAGEFMRIIASATVERLGFAAPRGNAKTTFLLAFLLYCVVYKRKRFIIFITSTAELADIFLGDIKHELEDNERLAEDFPDACGAGPLWRENAVVTKNGVRVQALGAGKKIRGRKHRQYRPDLVCVDDIESDEHVRNLEQRDKTFAWLTKAVLKARGVAQKCDFLLSGTLLHFDSVLARILDPKRSPGWRRRIYKAVINWADRQDLWDRWQELRSDWHKSDVDREADAQAFFREHQAEMLAGTEVLWPEGESYLDLMQQRMDDGPAAFGSEKQNEPLDPSQCKFDESWFEWFDEVEIDGEWWLQPDHGTAVRMADCDTFGACDPSKGKHDRSGDPAALITIAAWPARHLPEFNGRYRRFFVVDGILAWMHPFAIEAKMFELHALRRYQRFGVEKVQFQELLADLIHERSLKDPTTSALRIVKLHPIGDKGLRIEKLISYVYGKSLLFSRRCTALYDHFRYWPQHPHDDGPDGVELCLETIGEIGAVIVSEMDGKVISPEDHSDVRQIERVMPERIGAVDRSSSCGVCVHYAGAPGTKEGKCRQFGFNVEARAIGCEAFEGVA